MHSTPGDATSPGVPVPSRTREVPGGRRHAQVTAAPAAAPPRAWHRHLELTATILLAVATVMTAWSAFQANKWNAVQTRSYSVAVRAPRRVHQGLDAGGPAADHRRPAVHRLAPGHERRDRRSAAHRVRPGPGHVLDVPVQAVPPGVRARAARLARRGPGNQRVGTLEPVRDAGVRARARGRSPPPREVRRGVRRPGRRGDRAGRATTCSPPSCARRCCSSAASASSSAPRAVGPPWSCAAAPAAHHAGRLATFPVHL